jgi:TonB family protein
MKRKGRKMRHLLPLTWSLASLVAGMGTTPTRAASDREAARAAYAARVSEILRARTYLDRSAQGFRMDPRRPARGFVRIRFEIDPSGSVQKFRVLEASSDLHARKAEEIVSGLRLPPPPDGGFVAEQAFNFR